MQIELFHLKALSLPLLTNTTASSLPILDIVLGALLAIGLIRGLMKGAIVEVASLLALLLGIYGAINFSFYAVDFLNQYLDWGASYITITAFILTFILIVLAVTLVGKFFTRLAKLMALGLVNRLLGGIFGVLKTGFILSVILLFLASISSHNRLLDPATIEQSILYHPLEQLGAKVLPSLVDELQNHSDWTLGAFNP